MKVSLGNQRYGQGYYYRLVMPHWKATIYRWCDDESSDPDVLWSVYDNTGNLQVAEGETATVAEGIKAVFDVVHHLEMREFHKRLYDMGVYRNWRPV